MRSTGRRHRYLSPSLLTSDLSNETERSCAKISPFYTQETIDTNETSSSTGNRSVRYETPPISLENSRKCFCFQVHGQLFTIEWVKPEQFISALNVNLEKCQLKDRTRRSLKLVIVDQLRNQYSEFEEIFLSTVTEFEHMKMNNFAMGRPE